MSIDDEASNPNTPVTEAKVEAGRLASIGGSDSDDWNLYLTDQVLETLSVRSARSEDTDKRQVAAVAALMGIAPKDEIEGMMAAQLVAAHNATMECHRRAMLRDQTFEGRRENLNHANKLSRTFATLVEALNRPRGKGQQKVTVEHVHVHAGGQAVVGMIDASGSLRGEGSTAFGGTTRCKADCLCT